MVFYLVVEYLKIIIKVREKTLAFLSFEKAKEYYDTIVLQGGNYVILCRCFNKPIR